MNETNKFISNIQIGVLINCKSYQGDEWSINQQEDDNVTIMRGQYCRAGGLKSNV